MTAKVREDSVLESLLATGSIAGAALYSKWSESTIRRMLRRPKFARKLDRLREQALKTALVGLAGNAGVAIVALKNNAQCGKPAVEVSAADKLLGHLRGFEADRIAQAELEELKRKVAELERVREGTKP